MGTTEPSALPKSVAELARIVAGRAEGDTAASIRGVAALCEAGPEDVSFLGNMRYLDAAAATRAGCVILPASAPKIPCPARARIFVDDPQYAFSLILSLVDSARPRPLPTVDAKASIHYQAKLAAGVGVGPFTVIERGAEIGTETTIGSQCHIGENARIGRRCTIYPQVTIRDHCVVGDRCILHPGVVIGADGYGFSTDRKTGQHRKIPQLGNVVVQDDVEIGANSTIDRGTVGSTVIGAGTKIDNLVQIGHNCRLGRGCLLVAQVGVAGSTTVGDFVVLGGQVGVAGHLRIGDRAQVAAQSGIMSDVEPGQILFGSPARPHREAFKLQALFGKLPEMHAALKALRRPPQPRAEGGKPEA
ncbi:MAG: UDP-3-O-(3-hydroxymyristoyl)glucosamine N-acyltransferase [Elusimicrobia bacterium]|nr:UDP-3-O-(3-hydroxymyristoyl)glucosamine N-acyltransferase [Elusimicrobiota bacterium]